MENLSSDVIISSIGVGSGVGVGVEIDTGKFFKSKSKSYLSKRKPWK